MPRIAEPQKLSIIIIGVIGFLILMAVFRGNVAAIIIIIVIYSFINKLKVNIKAKPMSETIQVNNSFFSRFMGGTKKVILSVLGAIVLIWLVANSIVVVGAGQVGVYSLFGRVSDDELRPGFHVINPFASVYKLSTRTEEYTMSKTVSEGKKVGDDSISALTREGLNVSLDITSLYHLDENKASDVYREVGPTFEEKVIRPEIRSAIREVIAQYDAKDIYSEKREEAGQKIYTTLETKIIPRGIILEEILIRNVELPQNLSQAIQEKLRADQEAQKYEFLLDKEKKEAQRKVIEAEGQRDSQRIINESLTDNYLYYQYINQLKDRQGTIYVPVSGSTGMPLFKEIGK